VAAAVVDRAKAAIKVAALLVAVAAAAATNRFSSK
jgi:hypothetical protein